MARTRKRWLRGSIFLAIVLPLLFVTACSSNSGSGANDGKTQTAAPGQSDNGKTQGSATPDKPKERVTISIARSGNAPADVTENNPTLKHLQDTIGANFKFEIYPSNLYSDKIRVKLAGGDIPDAFVWNLGLDDLVMSLIKADKIVPLDTYIDKYPVLKSLNPYNRVRYDGKVWAITAAINPANSSDIPMIRQDWLDRLHLEAPKTTDDLLKVATAFAQDDPDGNGKKDTYGIALGNGFLEPGLEGANGIAQAFGLDNAYMKQADGKYVPQIADPNFKLYLDWMQKAYKSGAIDPDFITIDGGTALSKVTSQGTLGITFNYSGAINMLEEENGLKKTLPTAKLVPLEAIVGPNGDRGAKGRVSLAGIYVSKAAASNPDKMDKLMEWLEWGATPEGGLFGNYGVEGVDYTKGADGNIVVNNEAAERDKPSMFVYTRPLQPTAEIAVNKQFSEEAQQLVSQAATMNEPYIKITTTSEAYSPTQTKYRSEIQSFIVENISKAIIGKISLDQWDQVVKEWYSRFEGDRIVEEIAAFMEKS